jgi:NADP-dependent 3-hydroxy acid dehydrogenase YdfG
LAARQADKLQEVAAEIRAAGGTALAVTLDLASPESIEDAFLEGLEGVRPGSDPGQ